MVPLKQELNTDYEEYFSIIQWNQIQYIQPDPVNLHKDFSYSAEQYHYTIDTPYLTC